VLYICDRIENSLMRQSCWELAASLCPILRRVRISQLDGTGLSSLQFSFISPLLPEPLPPCQRSLRPKGKRYPVRIGRETRLAIIRSAGCQAADFRLCSLLSGRESNTPQVRIMIPSCVRQLRPIGGECEILAALQAVGRLTTYSPTERKANRNHSKPDTGRKWPAQ